MKINKPKSRKKTLTTKTLLIPTIIMLGCIIISCNKKNKSPSLIFNHLKSAPITDSMVVDQLIQRSRSFYSETGMKAKPFDSFLQEAIDIAKKRQLIEQEAIILNMIGKRYRDRALYGEALRFHHQALNKALDLDNKNLLSDIYNQIGVVYRRTDDNAMALEMHFKALKLAEEVQDTFCISVAINSIGNVNFNLEKYHSAIEYFLKSMELSEITDNNIGLAINNHNIGECKLKMNLPDEALDYFFKSLDLNTSEGSKNGQAICFSSIGSAYILKNDLNNALEYLQRSLNINEKLGDLMQVAISHSKIGETYMLMDNHDMAKSHIEKAFDLAVNIGSKFHSEENARLLSYLHEINNDFNTSLQLYKMASTYRDSIINEKNMFHLITMEANLDMEAQRERITQLNRETLEQKAIMERQQLTLTIFIIVAAVLIIVSILLIYQHRLRTKYNNLKNQQKLLRSQMNPHFIFNALSAIQVYVLEHDVEKSTKFLTDFAKLMRLVLKTSHHDYIPIHDETEILKYYLELQQLRFLEPFKYRITIDGSLDNEDTLIPPMLTQPFVENAVEHGIKCMDDEGMLDIHFKKAGSQMIIEVDDNGIGISSSIQQKKGVKTKHESMAIKITRERLDVIRNDTGGKVGLEIIDKKNINPNETGTLIRIILPVVIKKQLKVIQNG